jgi:hypothetical protein
MTYDQAIIKKKSLSSIKYTEDNMTFYVFVTPNDHKDFILYIDEVRGFFYKLSDIDSKKYSSNDDFSVCALCYNGASIIYKKL